MNFLFEAERRQPNSEDN